MASPKAPTPGQDELLGSPDDGRLGGKARRAADRGHRLGDAPQVAAAVVDDDHAGAPRVTPSSAPATSAWASRALISPTVYVP